VLDTPTISAIKLSWTEATDNQTPQAQIAYDIYGASSPGGEYFMGGPTMTVTGVNQAIVMSKSATTTYWVVRARDTAMNQSQNLQEAGITTETSLSLDVQPVFDQNCTNCHSLNTKGNTPLLDPGFTYSQVFGSWAQPGNGNNSILYTDVIGNPPAMPVGGFAAINAAQAKLIKDWIDQGPKDN
jgi:mono/diheme cytochrome c family protein